MLGVGGFCGGSDDFPICPTKVQVARGRLAPPLDQVLGITNGTDSLDCLRETLHVSVEEARAEGPANEVEDHHYAIHML